MNMQRYARFALTTSVGMFYTVAKPLYDLLRCDPPARQAGYALRSLANLLRVSAASPRRPSRLWWASSR